MTATEDPSDPAEILDQAEFCSYLQSIRQRADISYRKVSERAGELPANGGWVALPPTTVFDFLHTRLPTKEQLRTFLHVCRVLQSERRKLLATWIRITENSATEPAHYSTAPNPAPAETGVLIGAIPPQADCFQHRDVADRLAAATTSRATLPTQQHVVSGLGGVGKTQIAATFAHNLLVTHAADLVVWVPASTRTGIITSYAQAADVFNLPGRSGDPEQDCARWLAWLTTTPQRWAVVLDDVTDADAVRDLWPPTTMTGRTIITTRRRDATLLAGRTLVDVDVFTPIEARRYLTAKLPDHLTDDLIGVAADLDHLPLALGHAAAYMIDLKVRCSAYRERFADQRRGLATLFPDPKTLYNNPAMTVATTWALSIEQADSFIPVGVARPLLQLVSLLDPTGIPVTAFTTPAALTYLTEHCRPPVSPDNAARSRPESLTEDDVVGGLANLCRLNLISTVGETVRTHALVQRAVRETLPDSHAVTTALAAADALLHSWPEVERDAEFAATLRANSNVLSRFRPNALIADLVHPLLFRTARSLGEAGLLNAAVVATDELYAQARDALGPNHPDTLTARGNLAYWRGEAGDHTGAIAAFERLLTDVQRERGLDHPHALAIRGNLAYWHGRAGKPTIAATIAEQLLTDQVRVLGPDHPDTLTTRNNLARWRGEAGDPTAAADATEQLLTDQVRVLGPDHPDTLTTRNNLAQWRGDAGDPNAAATAFEQLLADRRRVLGPDHPHTLTTRNNLAYWRGKAGDPIGAADATQELLTDISRVLGPDHPHTLATRGNLVRWHAEAGHLDRATIIAEQLLADFLRVVGPDHPWTLTTRNNLAQWRGEAGDSTCAATAFEQLLADRLQALGPDHPDTLTTRGKLARWRGEAGDPTAAATAFEQLLPDALRVLGPDHPEIQTIRSSLDYWRTRSRQR
jgi:hypothetical protein